MPVSNSKPSRFTRGEKCIFTHVVITFAGIIAVVIIYLGHVCLVKHEGDRAFAFKSYSQPPDPAPIESPSLYQCVGAVYVRLDDGYERNACGAAAVRDRWSVVPARCVVARAHPHLSHLLPYWTLRYDQLTTGVKRGTPHPQYEHEEANDDIGLFEHEEPLITNIEVTPFCAVPDLMRHEEFAGESTELFIVGWLGKGERVAAAVTALSATQCAQLAAPVAQTTEASLCLTPRHSAENLPQPLLGAMVFEGSRLVAMHSWGDGANNSLPLVAVDIAPYNYWIETTVKLFPQHF